MTMEDMLGKVADGWTVKAVYSNGGERLFVEGTAHANDATQWYEFRLPEARLGLRQIGSSVTHANLVDVLSVTPPPVYTNAPDTAHKNGDVVRAAEYGAAVVGDRWMCGWSFLDDAHWVLIQSSSENPMREGGRVTREALPDTLTLVGRVQPWPLKDSDDLFATAQRMIAKQIREIYRVDSADHDVWLEEAALVVERFDLDDAYPEGDPHDW